MNLDHTKILRYYRAVDEKINKLVDINKNGAVEVLGEEVDANSIKNSIADIIADLSKLVARYGVSSTQASELVAIITDNGNRGIFTSRLKAQLINLLYSYDPIDGDTVIRVIGCIGINSLRNNEKQYIHKNLQIKLVKWLYLNILINNIADFKQLAKLLPMIFLNLNIEYIRSFISLIILKILLHFNCKKIFLNNFMKPWRLNYLIELNKKTTNDEYLIVLLTIFKDFIGDGTMVKDDEIMINYRYKINSIIKEKKISINLFSYPDYNFLNRMIEIKQINNNGNNNIPKRNHNYDTFVENIHESLQLMEICKDRFKRRKIISEEQQHSSDLLSIIHFNNNNNIYTIYSKEKFVNEIENLKIPLQIGSVLFQLAESEDAEIRRNVNHVNNFQNKITTLNYSIYLIYSKLDQELIKNLNSWCEMVLIDDDINNHDIPTITIDYNNSKNYGKIFQGLLKISENLQILLPIIINLLQQKIKINYSNNNIKMTVFDEFAFLPYLSLTKFDFFYEHYFKKYEVILLESKYDEEWTSKLLRSLIELFQNWSIRYGDDNEDAFEMYKIINKVYEIILNHFSTKINTTNIQLQILSFLQFLHKIPFQYIKISNLIIPPILCYQFILSSNPTILSLICKHISFTKSYYSEYYSKLKEGTSIITYGDDQLKNKEQLNNFKNLHNSYVMDICNLIWRNKPFEFREQSSSKGLLLPPEFIQKLSNLKTLYENTIMDDYQYDDDFFQQSFNVFNNPALNNISTTILRDLEDKDDKCIKKYLGPITESNFNSFIKKLDGSDSWINNKLGIQGFDDFRILLLKRITKSGLDGIGELLFNSLKSLLNKKDQIN